VGDNESSFVRAPNDTYIYTPHEKQTFRGAISEDYSNTRIHSKKKMFRVGRGTHLVDNYTEYLMPDGYSIMSTPCFVHRAYLRMFFDPLIVPVSAVKYVEELGDCEDILLSIMVTKFLKDSNRTECGVLATLGATNNGKVLHCYSLLLVLSPFPIVIEGAERSSHSKRSLCLDWFCQLYGHLPLKLSNFIATSI
jgi:hypothetical protein